MRGPIRLALCLAACLSWRPSAAGPAEPAPAETEWGVIEGVLALVSSPPGRVHVNAYPGMAHGAQNEKPEGGPAALMSETVLYLQHVSAPFHASAPPNPELAQADMSFVPRVLPILAGQTVGFPNKDPFYHNVFSYSSTERFDLGRYPSPESRRITFDEPGEVRVFCDIHSDMNAVILVLQNPYFTMPREDGRFRLSGVPEGRYTLVIWHPDLEEKRTEVAVDNGATVRLDLEL
jgi:plastocyanin